MAKTEGAPSIPKAKLEREPIQLSFSNTIFIEKRPNVPIEKNPDRVYMTHEVSRGTRVDFDANSKMARLFKLCYSIISSYPLETTKFMILNRSNYLGFKYESMFKFKRKLESCFSQTERQKFRNFDSQVECSTAHSSKGEEADVVIILNILDRNFPKIHPDNKLYRLLGISVGDVHSEEERLFYVALTRAKHSLHLVTERGRESEFLHRVDWEPAQLFSPSRAGNKSSAAHTVRDEDAPF